MDFFMDFGMVVIMNLTAYVVVWNPVKNVAKVIKSVVKAW